MTPNKEKDFTVAPEYQTAVMELKRLEEKLHHPNIRQDSKMSLEVANQYAETREKVRNLINNL